MTIRMESSEAIEPTPTPRLDHLVLRSLFLVPLLLWATTVVAQVADSLRLCGNGVIDAGESCDDHGLCAGGSNAGTFCSSDSECFGPGVCVGGRDDLRGCVNDEQCRDDGECRRCKPYGGDGCASNCTVETDVPFLLSSQRAESVSTLHLQFFDLPVPLEGSDVIRLGAPDASGKSPAVVRTSDVARSRAFVTHALFDCMCPRAVTLMTCGGTLFDADGSESLHCTPNFPGEVVCPADRACAAVHGPGNSASGFFGCGLGGYDIALRQDCRGDESQPPADREVTLASDQIGPQAGRAAAFLIGTEALARIDPSCSGTAADYGPDGEFCTNDDPIGTRGTPRPIFLTTESVSALLLNPNNFPDLSHGPFLSSGARYQCSGASGDDGGLTFVGVSSLCDRPRIGDDVSIYRVESSTFRLPQDWVHLTVGDANTQAGRDAYVAVSIESGLDVGGLQFDLLFDDSILYLPDRTACTINNEIGSYDDNPGCRLNPPQGHCWRLYTQLTDCDAEPTAAGCDAGPNQSRLRGILQKVVEDGSALPVGKTLVNCRFRIRDASRLPTVVRPATVIASDLIAQRIDHVQGFAGAVKQGPPCVGDCDRGGDVTVDELVRGISIALGNAAATSCPAFDADANGDVTVDEIVRAVNFALSGC